MLVFGNGARTYSPGEGACLCGRASYTLVKTGRLRTVLTTVRPMSGRRHAPRRNRCEKGTVASCVIAMRPAAIPAGCLSVWGHSSVGRALESHSRGPGFESQWLHFLPAPRRVMRNPRLCLQAGAGDCYVRGSGRYSCRWAGISSGRVQRYSTSPSTLTVESGAQPFMSKL